MFRLLLTFILYSCVLNHNPLLAQVGPPIELANRYNEDIVITDYLVSEKLDGVRARWNNEQLITRSGNPISAPDWFIRGFPAQFLDGELWIARKKFEKTASVVLTQQPDERWRDVKFMIFDLPEHPGPFSERFSKLETLIRQANLPQLKIIPQLRFANTSALMEALDTVIAKGGEGLMLHYQDALYVSGRGNNVLKLKKHMDAEAIVLAYLPGKGKYLGMMGALIVQMSNGQKFKIGSGFSDDERLNPPAIGSVITYKYYDFTVNGIPKFASYMRQITPK
ncbi:DNA ligase [Paraglaciecola sp. 20A4]|uniref:DNA ligase n=1 Tax=Paraglaciecola sp. 20A4 TaxID=2687288 RepID=UPI00140E6625|nr:DNA ligase [Paraglaciecola sp. 20A4]